jgi:tRNA1(Val) A37 N6-methylase TrmN6
VTIAVTLDRFLNGRITVAQPVSGFRAGHDSLLLAAAVPAEPNSSVLELGSGAGVASLCLAARVPDIRITGIEIDPELVRLANENAARNAFADRVLFVLGEAETSIFEPTSPSRGGRSAAATRGASGGGQPPQHLIGSESFDHVFFNPPFHPNSAHVSPVAARDRATRDTSDAVRAWTGRALALARDGGTVTAIIRADRVEEIVDASRGYGGVLFPLLPRLGVTPKRVIVQIKKSPIVFPSPLEGEGAHSAAKQRASGRKGGDTQSNLGFVTAAGLILHEADGRSSEAAEAVLRHGKSLTLAP